jgi:predicted enzyme related to lactoylglutathione lyase
LPSIVHFEVPIDDLERAKKFYTELFDWKIEKATGPFEYWTISTTADDEDSNTIGGIGGRMMKRQDSQQRIGNYVGVASIEDYTYKVEKLGWQYVWILKAIRFHCGKLIPLQNNNKRVSNYIGSDLSFH